MKNVFFIVIDSFFTDKLGDTRSSNSPTPFLDELRKKSLYCSNMYSQGPYTEAGSKALLTGYDSLNYGGYMHNIHGAKTTYLDVFKHAGYNIVDFFLPYYMYSTKEFENIDQSYFITDFSFDSVWTYRLQHFADIIKQRPLTDLELKDVNTQLDLTFVAWLNLFDKMLNGDAEPFSCLKKSAEDYDWETNHHLLRKEYDEYNKNNELYIKKILEEGRNCGLFKIERFDFTKMLNQDIIYNQVFIKHQSFLKSIRKKQLLLNLKNQHIEWRKFVKSLGSSLLNFKLEGWARQYIYALTCSEMAKGYTSKRFYQTLPSMRNMIRTAISYVHNNKSSQPILLHCHPEELHNRVNYFSFDIPDEKLVDREFKLFENYLGSLKSSYKGNILYDCALLYVDDCIKELYESLEREGILKNSIIIVCADHGSSYTCEDIRDNVCNNCHTENYHIPLIIFDGSCQEGYINSLYHTSKDILATVYSKCGINLPEYVTGEPITKESGSNMAVSEYMGGGCPDLRSKPILFIARDSHYLVYLSAYAFEDFSKGELIEVYDLKNDPHEKINIKDSLDKSCISQLLDMIKIRHDKIADTFSILHPDFDPSLYI